jgi:hypothetical protein
MDTEQVHIDSYDEKSHSVTAHFTGVKDGVEYSTAKYAFGATSNEASSTESLIKKLAQIGLAYLNQEVEKQQSISDENVKEQLRALNNTTHSFTSADFTTTHYPAVNINIVDNLEIQI